MIPALILATVLAGHTPAPPQPTSDDPQVIFDLPQGECRCAKYECPTEGPCRCAANECPAPRRKK